MSSSTCCDPVSEAENRHGVEGSSTQKRRQNQLEPPLMVELVELGRLKKENILIHCFEYEEDIAHLEYENHPGDAERDEGALDEGEDPHLNKFHDCCHRFVWWAKGLREDEGAALKMKNIFGIKFK